MPIGILEKFQTQLKLDIQRVTVYTAKQNWQMNRNRSIHVNLETIVPRHHHVCATST